MYLDAEYGESAPLELLKAILLYGSEKKIRLATMHQPIRDPAGGPALLDAGEPLTREFLEILTRGLGSELPSTFDGLVGASTGAQYVLRPRLRWPDAGRKTLSASPIAVCGSQWPADGLGSRRG